jgi:hypothetical protein
MSAIRTCTVRKLFYPSKGGPPRVITITLPWTEGFGDEANEKGADHVEPAPLSQKRRWGPRHSFERGD